MRLLFSPNEDKKPAAYLNSDYLTTYLVLYQLLFACNNEIIRTVLWLEQLTWCVQ